MSRWADVLDDDRTLSDDPSRIAAWRAWWAALPAHLNHPEGCPCLPCPS